MRLHESRVVRALICASMLVSISPLPLLAQEAQRAPAPATTDVDAALRNARDSIKNGSYDQAIETLQGVIGQHQHRIETLREAYLLLIKAFVYEGNSYKGREQGRQQSLLNYDKASALIDSCLHVRELRHTRPEPETDYPPEMVQLFKEVRARSFGSFRVTDVSPAGAVVLFDADTLMSSPGESVRGDVDIAVGRHRVVVRSSGYRDVTDEVTIEPGATLERPYQLLKPTRRAWYASGAAVVLAGGLAAILGKKSGGGTTAAQPLGGPPPPPTRPQ